MAMKQHINIVAQIIPIGNIGGCWSAIVASSACNPVAACPFVVVKGIISEKMHSLEAHCRQLLRQKRRYCPLSSSCGEIALENSVVHCIAAHPSYTQVAARYTAAIACPALNPVAMAATNALRSQSLFYFHFSVFTFFLLFFLCFCSPSELASALCSATQRM